VAKAQPKAKPKAAVTPARKLPHEPPPRAGFVKAVLDDLVRPLIVADAAELFAVKVVDIARKFDPFWFQVVIDLVTGIVKQCNEQDIKATIQEIAGNTDGTLAHLMRRRINRNLPVAPGESRLTETERYEMARAIVVAACDTLKEEDLWDALWGRKIDWFPVVAGTGDEGETDFDNEGGKSGTGYKADAER
jgi:hypothetical protein